MIARSDAPLEVVDTLIEARWVVPVEPDGVVLEHHAVAIRDGRIVALAPIAEARAQFVSDDVVRLPGSMLVPGLVNAHTHAAMTLMRGIADDLPLMQWLHEHIWPAEMKHMSAEFVLDGTLAAAAEMLRGGITCASDMYFHPEASARAFVDAGMRAVVGIIAFEFPSSYGSGPDEYLARGLAARDRFAGEPLVTFCLAPHAPYTVSNRTFERVLAIATELDAPVHCHVHESADEIAGSLKEHGVRPLDRLRAIGLVNPALIAVHAVHLLPSEIDLLARHGASVVHCPSSNLKLASGLAPVAAMAAAGINLALGTDGAASNNRLDLLQEARTAALLAKGLSGDAAALPAHAVLRAATLGGARALGLEASIGSITVGKAADLCSISLVDTLTAPCYDPLSHLIYVLGREHVENVWVDGHQRVREGRLDNPLMGGLEKRIFLWHNKLRA